MEVLPLEKPLLELSKRIVELRETSRRRAGDKHGKAPLSKEMDSLEKRFGSLALEIFSRASAYEVTQLARHPQRPTTLELIAALSDEFVELQGDRNFRDDPSLVGGIGLFRGRRVLFLGHQKGRTTKENMVRNFGMPKPEGYRKALRLMSLAERFHLPIVTFIDTPGAYPGVDAEERGQSEAIAKSIMVMFRLGVPIVTLVTGEGGSGGALAIGVGNRVLMMEYSVYSVISPEGCASILWKDGSFAGRAAEALRITAGDALRLGVVDEVVREPLGGAHWNPQVAIQSIGDTLEASLGQFDGMSEDALRAHRAARFGALGPVGTDTRLQPLGLDTPLDPSWGIPWEEITQGPVR